MATNTRTDNLVEYVTPSVSGFSADLAYGAGEAAGNSAKNRTLGGTLAYEQGPLNVQLAHHRLENAAGTDSTRNTLLAASYKFGAVTAQGAVARNRGVGAASSRDMVLGVAVPVYTGKLLASHVRHDDRTAAGKDASQWGIGYSHPLSKRTDIYSAYARIHNKKGAAYTVGNATDKGSGNSAFDLGVRHTF